MATVKGSKYLLQVQKTVGLAINRYGLIRAGDRVAVGVSGGKDSFVLLESLALRRRWIPIYYDIHAVHINVKNITPELDREYFTAFCKELGASFHYRSIGIDSTRDPSKTVCFVCAWHRRKEIFSLAKELGCNRIAMGHHMDDAIETLFLNMTFNGSISAMPPKLTMFNGEFDIIRPLILLSEREIERYAKLRGFTTANTRCPYGDTTRRAAIKHLIGGLSNMNRKAKKSIFASMSNIHREYLPPDNNNN